LDVVLLGSDHATTLVLLAVAVPLLAGQALKNYPATAAKKRNEEVLRTSASATSLMIMSLREEASMSRAMMMASRRGGAFADELRRSIWEVVMGKHASFEEALHALGRKWVKAGAELKTALNALVAASRERTEEGKRRALDRANNAVVQGAKRRIEEYALSLSAPTMVLFGLGILMPLMVGSFLPMLSWSIWDTGLDASRGEDQNAHGDLVETVFLMNVLFPAVALVVALGAAARHPMESSRERRAASESPPVASTALVLASSLVAGAGVLLMVDGELKPVLALGAAVCPFAAWLVARGKRAREEGADTEGALEDLLFMTGARMVEGENLETSLWKAGKDSKVRSQLYHGRTSFHTSAAQVRECPEGVSNAHESLRIVGYASAKDEQAAGMLAMDLAAYLKDLRDLEESLTSRLKPTISMMRMTAYALAPVVLGVTYAIYLTLASIAGDPGAVIAGDIFFLTLGAFLAQTNAVVCYFVWGIEGRGGPGALLSSMGSCLLISTIVYSATALAAA